MEFVGGGFDTWSSLRYGVFYTESAGTLIKTPVDATCWSGTDNNHSGYLFLPRSGSYAPVNWQLIGKDGSWGAIVDGLWLSTYGKNNYVLGTNLQLPANAVAGAGTYDFAISVAPQGDGTSDVRFKLNKNDNSYLFQGRTIDNHSPLATVKFNGVNFALNAYKSTTAMKLTDVKVDLGASIPVGVEEAAGVEIPTVYALNQNYPNPFNPSTTVRYDIPKSSQVSVKIYDVLGRLVATLVDGVQSPNRYSIQWSPSALSSGVYFCRIEARSHDGSGEFTAVKKLLLMK
jgi:hypothetical protein